MVDSCGQPSSGTLFLSPSLTFSRHPLHFAAILHWNYIYQQFNTFATRYYWCGASNSPIASTHRVSFGRTFSLSNANTFRSRSRSKFRNSCLIKFWSIRVWCISVQGSFLEPGVEMFEDQFLIRPRLSAQLGRLLQPQGQPMIQKRLASYCCYKLKPLSLFISILLMLKKTFDNVKIDKWKVKVVLA